MNNEIKYIYGDATEPVGEGNRMIAHICNDIGAWGAGFVLAISKKWKEPEEHYRKYCKKRLGSIDALKVEDSLYVVNMIAQSGIRSSTNTCPISYRHLRTCLENLFYYALGTCSSVHMPMIGTGLAGGDWNIIEPIIQEELVSKGIQVYVYKLVN